MTRWLQHCSLHFQSQERVLASEWPAWQQHYSLHLPRECLHQNEQPDNSTIHYTSQESACVRMNSLTTALFTTPPITRESACVRTTRWLQHCSLHFWPQERVLVSERTAWQQHYSLHLPRVCLHQNKQPDNSTIHYTSNHKWECLHQNDQVTTAH